MNASLREICERADMKGELELRPSLTNDEEFALEARVALNRGDAMISYLDSAHSGGERAKISVLLLLAAMSSEVAARLGGGHDAELCAAATGVDLNALTVAMALADDMSKTDMSSCLARSHVRSGRVR